MNRKITIIAITVMAGLTIASTQAFDFENEVKTFSLSPQIFSTSSIYKDSKYKKAREDEAPNTVIGIKKMGFNEQHITMVGRLTDYDGGNYYIFTDNTGSIKVRLNSHYDWNHIEQNQLICVYGIIQKEFLVTSIDIEYAQALERKPEPDLEQIKFTY